MTPLLEKGMDYDQLQQANIFDLMNRIASFNRKQELEAAQLWFSHEVSKLKDEHKPKVSPGGVEMKPVNEDVVLDDLIEARFEN